MDRVFSQKHSSTSIGNGAIYSMGIDSVYQKWQFGKTECFASVSREGLTCETLVKISCLHPVLTLHIPVICRAHASLCGKFTRKLPVKIVLVFNWPWVFTLSFSHTIKTFIKLMTSWIHGTYMNKKSAIKFINYITYKHILIKQGQSLKNDYNEHLTSKCSSGHAKQ